MILIADISNNQQAVNLGHLAAAGVGAIYHKATEGTSFVDPDFQTRRAAAHNLQLPFGAYHFAHPQNDPIVEASHFCKAVGQLGHRDLRPALDLETGDPAHAFNFAVKFNNAVHTHLGVWPLFYSYPDYIARARFPRAIGDGLWLASYSRNDGRDHPFMVPQPWQHALVHQFTSVGKLNGVPFHVDLSHIRDLAPLWVHPILARLS